MDDPQVFLDFLGRCITDPNDVNGAPDVPAIDEIVNNLATTFREFSGLTDADMDYFIKQNNERNRHAVNPIVYNDRVFVDLKSVLFELRDQAQCGVDSDQATLDAITGQVFVQLRANRSNALRAISLRDKQKLPDLTVVPLTHNNWREFKVSVLHALDNIIGQQNIPLSYVLREQTGNYFDAFESRMERLIACSSHDGEAFTADNKNVYSLLVGYVGDSKEAKPLIDRHRTRTSSNGKLAWRSLLDHFESESFRDNLATDADKVIASTTYTGPKRNFNIATYYSRMTKAFQDKDDAGQQHALTESQKISTFRNGLKEHKAIECGITALKEWNKLPLAQQDFDAFYNTFSADLNSFLTATHEPVATTRYVRNTNTFQPYTSRGGRSSRGRGGRGRTGGRYNSRGGSGRGGRGRSGGRPFASLPVFHPELKIYPKQEYMALNNGQKQMIKQLKRNNGWLDEITPPVGYIIDHSTGLPTPDHSQQRQVNHMTSFVPPVPLPPPPTTIHAVTAVPPPPPPPPALVPPTQTNPTAVSTSAGAAFAPRRAHHADDVSTTSTISQVTINGARYNGPVFDRNGNQLS